MNTQTLPTHEALHAFLKAHYKTDRFEGRDNAIWGMDYSHMVTRGSMEQLANLGHGFIGKYESATGQPIKFSPQLEILPS